MTFYELYKVFDEKFPRSLSCEWDNDGIMCGDDLDNPVKKVLVTLDITDEAVDYAIENGFDTIVSHHPLVFKGQKALTTSNFVQRKLIKLIKNGIRAMSFHTRMDAGAGGVNDSLISALSLPTPVADPVDPIGRICVLDNAMTIVEFCRYVKEKLNATHISYIGEKNVKKVYICAGDGKDIISRAIECEADTLLTGNASYNSMLDACEMGINVIEAGHFFTENPVCDTVKEFVKSLDNSLEIHIFVSNKVEII